jgi:hypothetical protein
MERNKVYEVIDTERDYQLQFEDKEQSHIVSSLNMGGILTAIRVNLSNAEKVWYSEKTPYQDTTEYLRKIAALCVKAAEDYGMKERIIK